MNREDVYIGAGKNPTIKAIENIDVDELFHTLNRGDMRAYVLPADEGDFNYDAIGNLIFEHNKGVTIQWTPYGKVRQVTQKDGTVMTFRYDATGNRIEKKLVKPDNSTIITRYVRDASGNVMAVYDGTTVKEMPIYGSSRTGMYKGGRSNARRTLGKKSFELSNHLGNVLSVITDNIRMAADSAWAMVITSGDYYAFGSDMPGRDYTESDYRYGFNGKEKDEDGEWGSTAYDYGFRIYNPEIAKFLSVDPLTASYPMLTPYQFASNSPISGIDLDGLEYLPGIQQVLEQQGRTAIQKSGDEEALRKYNQSMQRMNNVGLGISGGAMVVPAIPYVSSGTAFAGRWFWGNWHHLAYNPIVHNEIAATIYGFGADDEWHVPAIGDNASKAARTAIKWVDKYPISKEL